MPDAVAELAELLREAGVKPRLNGVEVDLIALRDVLATKVGEALASEELVKAVAEELERLERAGETFRAFVLRRAWPRMIRYRLLHLDEMLGGPLTVAVAAGCPAYYLKLKNVGRRSLGLLAEAFREEGVELPSWWGGL